MFIVLYGAEHTMKRVAQKGCTALNRNTMRYQLIDKAAQYTVHRVSGDLFVLKSDKDLPSIAKNKGLIL